MTVNWDLPTRIAAILVLRSIQQGALIEMRLRKEGMKVLDLTPSDLKTFNINVLQNGSLQWDTEQAKIMTQFILSDGVVNLMRGKLDELEEKKAITEDTLALADFFDEYDKKQASETKDPEVVA